MHLTGWWSCMSSEGYLKSDTLSGIKKLVNNSIKLKP